MLGDPSEDSVQDGGGIHDTLTNFTNLSECDDGFIPVRGKQSKRQRISSGGQSGSNNQPETQDDELFETDFQDLSTDQKLSLIPSKLSVNEGRVGYIQNKLDTVLNSRSRVTAVENVIRSQNDRLKLLEFRSIDLEAQAGEITSYLRVYRSNGGKITSQRLGGSFRKSSRLNKTFT